MSWQTNRGRLRRLCHQLRRKCTRGSSLTWRSWYSWWHAVTTLLWSLPSCWNSTLRRQWHSLHSLSLVMAMLEGLWILALQCTDSLGTCPAHGCYSLKRLSFVCRANVPLHLSTHDLSVINRSLEVLLLNGCCRILSDSLIKCRLRRKTVSHKNYSIIFTVVTNNMPKKDSGDDKVVVNKKQQQLKARVLENIISGGLFLLQNRMSVLDFK